tara:strand:- start:531 stop:827 length:297 start_codon:yes stop_codon:yes gene_type:complete
LKKIDKHINDAIENISNDRALALTLLTDLMKSMNASHDHKELGQIASKYLETLQRSNEQLVKVSALLHKTNPVFAGLTPEDKENIYSLIEEQDTDTNG